MAGAQGSGKLIGACALRYKPEVEAAFQAHYGIDVIRNPPTPRRMMVLFEHLPPGVAAGTDSADSWTQESHLLAGVIDSINVLTAVTLKAAGAKNVKTPPPVPRPGKKSPAAAGRKLVEGGLKGLASALSGITGVVTS